MNGSDPAQDGFEIYCRLFNHRPFLQGEIDFFVKNFQEKRGDREIENIFGILERVSELRDFGADKLESELRGSCTNISENLEAAESVVASIIETSHSTEIEKTLVASRQCREKELAEFSSDIQRQYKKIDENFLEREIKLTSQYKNKQ